MLNLDKVCVEKAKQNGLDNGVEEFLKMFCEAPRLREKSKVQLDAEEEEEEGDSKLAWRPLPLRLYFPIYFCQNLNGSNIISIISKGTEDLFSQKFSV